MKYCDKRRLVKRPGGLFCRCFYVGFEDCVKTDRRSDENKDVGDICNYKRVNVLGLNNVSNIYCRRPN